MWSVAETTQGEREKKTNTTKEEKVEGPRVELFILSINPLWGRRKKEKGKATGKVHWPSALRGRGKGGGKKNHRKSSLAECHGYR